ncbi:hypothetical protein ACFQ69_35980 [Streptomyces sp. NPDC056470]|uniref:hypothetical protein n=1 Tax=Streptomyces sp. NPDC056470 TaxID=3345831 RepID=UPI0036909AE8
MAGAVALVSDEPLGVFKAQHCGVMAGVGGVGLEEDTQFDGCAAFLVEGASGAGALRGTERLGEMVPEQVRQPQLGNDGDVEVASGTRTVAFCPSSGSLSAIRSAVINTSDINVFLSLASARANTTPPSSHRPGRRRPTSALPNTKPQLRELFTKLQVAPHSPPGHQHRNFC